MPHFVHLSDPHLTPIAQVPLRALIGKRVLGYLSWQRRRRHRHLPELLRVVTTDALASAPQHIALTGDLTQIGLPQEHALAAEWMAGLGATAPISLAPGNHDFYARDSARTLYARWSDYLDGPDGWPMRRDCGELSFISLCSGVPSGAAFATGRLGQHQLQRLAAVLRASAGRCRVLLIHHSPHAQGHTWRKRLTDAPDLRAVLASEGVELILHGHAHCARLVWMPSGNTRIPVLGAPSASLRSSAPDHRAGYHGIDVERATRGWDVRIETRQHDGSGMQTSAEHRFTLNAR